MATKKSKLPDNMKNNALIDAEIHDGNTADKNNKPTAKKQNKKNTRRKQKNRSNEKKNNNDNESNNEIIKEQKETFDNIDNVLTKCNKPRNIAQDFDKNGPRPSAGEMEERFRRFYGILDQVLMKATGPTVTIDTEALRQILDIVEMTCKTTYEHSKIHELSKQYFITCISDQHKLVLKAEHEKADMLKVMHDRLDNFILTERTGNCGAAEKKKNAKKRKELEDDVRAIEYASDIDNLPQEMIDKIKYFDRIDCDNVILYSKIEN